MKAFFLTFLILLLYNGSHSANAVLGVQAAQ